MFIIAIQSRLPAMTSTWFWKWEIDFRAMNLVLILNETAIWFISDESKIHHKNLT